MSLPADADGIAAFESRRSALLGLAYRMLGSRSEAEDVVQDAFLRWHRAERPAIEDPSSYLRTIVTRLCLDRMKSAQRQREIYVGQWLPELMVDENLDAPSASDLAHDLSVALMMTLERLSPLERAAFLLHAVFECDFPEVARALGRSEPACRQLAARARAHIREERPRFTATPEEGQALAEAFRKAAESGDVLALRELMAADAVLYTDGGGKRSAGHGHVRQYR